MKNCRYLCLLFSAVASWPLAAAQAQDASSEAAVQYLTAHQPAPDISLGWGHLDPKQVETDTQVIEAQMKSLTDLVGTNDTHLIPLLISFLGYNTHFRSPYLRETPRWERPPSERELSNDWPAFAVLVQMPGSANGLTAYARDTKNPLDYRVAAFHVLRYIDSQKFKMVAGRFDIEFANANSDKRHFIKGIEDGAVSFGGVFPLSAGHDRPGE